MSLSDPEEIYLAPASENDEYSGRSWCHHDIWDGAYCDGVSATKYVRADLVVRKSEFEALKNKLWHLHYDHAMHWAIDSKSATDYADKQLAKL